MNESLSMSLLETHCPIKFESRLGDRLNPESILDFLVDGLQGKAP